LSVPVEQLEREKTRAIIMAGLEIVLGTIMLYIGLQVLSVSDAWRYAMFQMRQQATEETMAMYGTALGIIMATGFFALLHGLKRIIDNILNAWVKSAIPKNPTLTKPPA
jgi:ascorbate-specific PTS system EIIC-type component UlaA